MFIDELEIVVESGKGGKGTVAFYANKKGPCGGNGGKGGDVLAVGNAQMSDLHRYSGSKKLKAEDGQPGGKNQREGKAGENLILYFPVGTVIIERSTNKEIEIQNENTSYVLAKGGKGGKGNKSFATSTNQVPKQSEPGQPSVKKIYFVVVKLIADFGLIGLPNAGKSTLLNELTNANVKTAMYPFTTLEPNLGEFNGKVIADIPGLIEGASGGRGLGHKFLKHVEKVPVILHCIASDSQDPVSDYTIVSKEMEKYNPKLLEKHQIILLTKTDLTSDKDLTQIVKKLKKFNKEIVPVSIYNPGQFSFFTSFISSKD